MIKKNLTLIVTMLMIIPVFATVTIQAWDCDLIASQTISDMGAAFQGLDDFFGAQEIGKDKASKISYIEGFEIRMQTLTRGSVNGYIALSETLSTKQSDWFWWKAITSDYDKGTQLGDSPQWIGFEVDKYVDLDNLYIIYEVESANDKFCWWYGEYNLWSGGDSYAYYDDGQYLGWHKKSSHDFTFKIYGREEGLPNHYAVFVGSDWASDASISKLKSVIDNGFWTDIKTVEGLLSKNEVLNAIDWLYDKSLSNKECTLLFYFCGHSGRNYVQLNGENMFDVEFQSAFSKFSTSDKLILIFDTCFSGRMDDDTEIEETSPIFKLLERIKERLIEITEDPKVTDALNKVIEKVTENIQKRIENTDPAEYEEIAGPVETVEPEETPTEPEDVTPTPIETEQAHIELIKTVPYIAEQDNGYKVTFKCADNYVGTQWRWDYDAEDGIFYDTDWMTITSNTHIHYYSEYLDNNVDTLLSSLGNAEIIQPITIHAKVEIKNGETTHEDTVTVYILPEPTDDNDNDEDDDESDEQETTTIGPDASVTIDCVEQHPREENDYTAIIRCSELNGGQYKIDKNNDGIYDTGWIGLNTGQTEITYQYTEYLEDSNIFTTSGFQEDDSSVYIKHLTIKVRNGIFDTNSDTDTTTIYITVPGSNDGDTDSESSNSGVVITTELDSPEEHYDGFFGNLVKRGRIVITSCKAGQSAWVHSNGYTAAFTYFLAEALRSTTYIENAFDEAKRDTQPHVFFHHGKLQNPQISDKILGNVKIKI